MSPVKRTLSSSILWLLPLLGPATLLLPGCFLRVNTVTEKFGGEFRCPKAQVKVEQPDKNQKEMYRATGCNRRANYRCTGDYGEFCERVGQPETIQPEGIIDSATPPGGTSSAPSAPKPAE